MSAPPKSNNCVDERSPLPKGLGRGAALDSFRTNTAYKHAREVERAFLLWIVQNDPSNADVYFDVLKPWILDVASFDQKAHELQTELRAELTARLLPHVAESAQVLFSTAGGISKAVREETLEGLPLCAVCQELASSFRKSTSPAIRRPCSCREQECGPRELHRVLTTSS
jgi:hypothetical protein